MRIAMSGAAGVGKSTLAKEIANKFNLTYIPEIARELMQEEKKFNWMDIQNDLETFIRFQSEIIKRKNDLENNNTNFVSDRTFVDSFVYVQMRFAREYYGRLNQNMDFDPSSTYLDFYNNYKNFCFMEDLHLRYDFLFFIEPFSSIVEDDGYRNPNPIYNQLYSDYLLGLLKDSPYKNKLVIINQNTLKDRIKFLSSYL